MKLGIPKETVPGELRVAVIPPMIPSIVKDGHEVLVQTGAGISASYDDNAYVQAGARIVAGAAPLFNEADVILKVLPLTPEERTLPKEGSLYLGFFTPHTSADLIHTFIQRKVTAFSMEYVPRITRAQSMDALSSMATIAGYKSVLLAAEKLDKMFPLLMTAAGTVPPATVLVLGVGVAGLQAIATAKRLGAKVEAFDPRPAVKEQVKSVGATFVEMEITENVEAAGGYAKEQSEEFLRKEREVIGARLPKVDVVICTAQIFGKRAPVLISKEMVATMRSGSIIIDLAAEQGGNCELTKARETTKVGGVTIIGAVNLPASVPLHASQMYSRNITNLFKHLFPKADTSPDFNDEIVKGSCITRNGEIVNESVRVALQGGKI